KGRDAFDQILNGSYQNRPNNQLFKALLTNNDFCQQFVITMMDLYNLNFHPDSCLTKLDTIADIYRPLMADYIKRFGGSSSTFENRVNNARKYLTDIRAAMTNDYLPTYFGGYSGISNLGVTAGNLYNVTISTTGVSGASIKINTVTPSLASGNWTGKYYSAIPVTVTASAPPGGYEFDGWTVTGGTAVDPSALTTTVNFTGNVQITANYK
ncbi:MAG: hypothetical protein LBI03_05180, partial [Clostridiales bacterium]|nr:hypothetical protein [Clostridiales bacterium]